MPKKVKTIVTTPSGEPIEFSTPAEAERYFGLKRGCLSRWRCENPGKEQVKKVDLKIIFKESENETIQLQ